jgi:hypothetical protein
MLTNGSARIRSPTLHRHRQPLPRGNEARRRRRRRAILGARLLVLPGARIAPHLVDHAADLMPGRPRRAVYGVLVAPFGDRNFVAAPVPLRALAQPRLLVALAAWRAVGVRPARRVRRSFAERRPPDRPNSTSSSTCPQGMPSRSSTVAAAVTVLHALRYIAPSRPALRRSPRGPSNARRPTQRLFQPTTRLRVVGMIA